MSIDWSVAPEGATHAAFLPDIQQHLFFKFADDRWFDVKNQEWSCIGGKPNFDLIERQDVPTAADIDWANAPEGATHYCKPHGMWHKAAYNPFRVWVWMQNAQDWELQSKERIDFWLSQGDLSGHNLLERPKNPLSQAVFDGLPPEYRWAAVDSDGRAYAHECRPKGKTAICWFHRRGCAAYLIGEGYDTTDWQNSLIERQDVPTAAGIDWTKAPEGATHCLIKDSGTAWFRFKDDNSFPNTWKDGEWKNVRLPTRELTPKPAPKRLTQAVFEGLPPEYRWAYLDRDGDPCVIADLEAEHDDLFPDHKPDCYDDGLEWATWLDSVLRRTESITDVARSIEAARQVEATLAERQNQYGDFKDVAHLSQGLQSLLSVGNFSDTQQEAIQMICSKLARLACGDADHVDSWHDIAGYATLVVKDLESGK